MGIAELDFNLRLLRIPVFPFLNKIALIGFRYGPKAVAEDSATQKKIGSYSFSTPESLFGLDFALPGQS